MTFVDWLHKRIFRGIGIAFVLAMLTVLAVTVMHIIEIEKHAARQGKSARK